MALFPGAARLVPSTMKISIISEDVRSAILTSPFLELVVTETSNELLFGRAVTPFLLVQQQGEQASHQQPKKPLLDEQQAPPSTNKQRKEASPLLDEPPSPQQPKKPLLDEQQAPPSAHQQKPFFENKQSPSEQDSLSPPFLLISPKQPDNEKLAVAKKPLETYFAALGKWASDPSTEAKADGRFFILRGADHGEAERRFLILWIPEELGVKRKLV